jgi:hypothetical protein
MGRNTLGNVATAAFFAAFSVFCLVDFIQGLEWPLRGHATSILFSIFFAGLAYRVIWGMRHGE